MFATDHDEAIVAIAQPFEARDQDSAGCPFPSAENCFILLDMLAVAQSTPLGALVDFSPLTVLLRGRSLGFQRTWHGLHAVLDCLAELALSPAHVITPDDPQAERAIQRLLAALYLALFGTVLVTVAQVGVLGCKPCGREIHGRPSWLGRAVGDAHTAGGSPRASGCPPRSSWPRSTSSYSARLLSCTTLTAFDCCCSWRALRASTVSCCS